jgi:hypothetical protein
MNSIPVCEVPVVILHEHSPILRNLLHGADYNLYYVSFHSLNGGDMGYKEYVVTDVLDILRKAKAKDCIRRISRAIVVDRNTIRSYLRIAEMRGFNDNVPEDRLAETA